MQKRLVKVKQRNSTNGMIEDYEFETEETKEQLLNHLHVIEIVQDEADKKQETEELVGEKETKTKGKAKNGNKK